MHRITLVSVRWLAGLCVVFAGVALAGAQLVSRPAIPIGTSYLELNSTHLSPESSNHEVRAFVPTGSLQRTCLSSLNETNFAGRVASVFCAPRVGFGQPGLLVSVFFENEVVDPLILNVTVYQEGAKFYGMPVLCQSTDGC